MSVSVKSISRLARLFEKLAEIEEEKLLLPMNKHQEENALDNKVTQIVDMDPLLMIELTAHPDFDVYTSDNFKPLDFYLTKEIQEGISVHPFLSIDKDTGKIKGHEGRHRAASVAKAGGKKVRVGIQLRPSSRSYKPEDMPKFWEAQFTNKQFSLQQLISSGRIKVIDDNVQKRYQRD